MEKQVRNANCKDCILGMVRRRNPSDHLVDDGDTQIVQAALDALVQPSSDIIPVLEGLLELSKAPEDELANFLSGKTLSLTNTLNNACHVLQRNTLFDRLVNIGSSSNAPAQGKAIALEILRNLSRNETNRLLMYRATNMVDTLRCCVMNGESPIIKEFALITLNNLALADVNAARLFELPGYIQMLKDGALAGESVNIRVWSLGNLRNLAVYALNAVRMHEPPLYVDEVLIQCARKDVEGKNTAHIRDTAIWALVNMTCGGNNRLRMFDKPGLIQTIVEACASKETRRHAIRTILSFSCAEENRLRLFQFPRLVDALVDCLVEGDQTRNKDEMEDAFRTLCELALHSKEVGDTLYRSQPRLIGTSLDIYNSGQNLHAWPASLMQAMRRSKDNLRHFNRMIVICSARSIPRLGKHSNLVLLPIDLIRFLSPMLCEIE